MKEHRYTAWIVNHRDKHDDEHAMLVFARGLGGRDAPEAWRKFIALCGGPRAKWNKLGYIAEQVEVSVKFKEKS
jgi:uncharacterized protein YaeQ